MACPSRPAGWPDGWGGAERIIVSQLSDTGTVKVYSSGSALDGGPEMYLHSPVAHNHGADFREIASFNPFDGTAGTRVAATSTTSGANLRVSGVSAQGAGGMAKYEFIRAGEKATTLKEVRLGDVVAVPGAQPAILGGD